MARKDAILNLRSILIKRRDALRKALYPIYDAVRAGAEPDHPLHEFLTWLNGDVFIQFVRDVVGDDTIAHVDAQATAFGPGHFLNAHDDLASGKDRRAAYVFGFTPDWRADWGGLLQFIDSNGDVRAGLCPRFNCLNLLAVPQLHNVGVVAPFAGGVRLSITGWLRGEERNGGIDLNEE